MRKRNKGILAVSVLFTLSFSAALAGCGGGHNPTLVAGKDPTCTEAGYEQYYLCTHCDKFYSDEDCENEISAPVAKAALGHDMTKHDEDEATCTHPGNVEYYTCSREPGVYYADQAGTQTLAEIGVTVDHDFSGETDGVPNTRPAVDPTKDEYGRKPSWTCNSCHTMYGDAYGDKVVTEEGLRIDKIQETIDGEITEEFYHEENAFVIGAENVRDGGLGMVLNATFAKDGVYFHLVTNYNTPAAEQDRWGSVKIYINARNTENQKLPGNAAVSEAETIVMNLGLNGNIGTHDAHTVKSHKTVTNEDGAPTKYTTVWEVYCSFEKLAETNKGVLQYAFEKQDGKTVLKNGYNILVTTVGCMFNKGEAERFDNNGTSVCRPIGDGDVKEAWYLWEKSGYSDSGAEHKYMIVTQEGFSDNFSTVATEYKVKTVADDNVTINGLSEKVAVNGTLEGTVTVKKGYVFRGLNINGKTVQASAGTFSVSLADLDLPWNTADITVTPVVVKDETQTVAVTLKDKTKDGVSLLANTDVSLMDGFGEPITGTTDANGLVTFNDLLCTTYMLTVDGYPQKTLVVTKGTGTAEFELIRIFAIAGNDNVIVSDLEKSVSIVEALNPDLTYTGTAEIVTDSALKTANVLLETTVRAENFEDGWTVKSNQQRFIIQMTESGKGLFFWVFNSNGYKANVKSINDLNNYKNEGGSELDINDWGEEGRGWIVPFIRSDDGLKLRVIRDGDSIALYAYDSADWVYFGEVGCAEDDQIKIVFYGAGCGWEFTQTSVTNLGAYVEEQLPEVGTPGHIAHYVNGDKYYLPDGTPTTAEEVRTEKKESTATVTLALKDLNGNSVTVAEGTKIKISSRFHSGTLTAGANGVLDGTIFAYEYTASLYGYEDTVLSVSESGEVTLTMEATIAHASNDKVTVDETENTITIAEGLPADKSYTGNAELVTDSALKHANVLFETTVKAVNFEDGWTGKSTMQRFIIQMTDGQKGVFFWIFNSDGDKANFKAINDLTNRENEGSGDLDLDKTTSELDRGWVVPFVKNDGLKLRLVRYGDKIALYGYNGTNWVSLGITDCGVNENLKICIYGTGCGWEFSQMSVSDLGTYVPATPEHFAHFVDGTNYYSPDGTPTTADAVKTGQRVSEATVKLVLKDLNGNSVTVADGTEVAIKSRYHIGTLIAGANGLLSGALYTGEEEEEYTASLYGYLDATFFVGSSGEITLTMEATIAHESNDNVIVDNKNQTITIVESLPADKSYTGNAELVTDGALKTADVVLETTVKAVNFEDGWTGKSTMQRFIVQVTDSGKGFFFWTWNADGNKGCYQEIYSLTNREENKGRDLNDWTEKEKGWIVPFVRGEGLKLRIMRSGNKIALYAYNGTEWLELGYTDCEANDNLKVCFYGTGCGWEFSEISVKAAEEYTLNATVTGNKAGVTTNLTEGATVRFTNLLGYDKTFTVGTDGTIGGANEKLPAGVYTVTVTDNLYPVYAKNITVSENLTQIAFEYQKFSIVERDASYDLYDFSHVNDENATIGSKQYVERFNALSTDTYDDVSVTLGGKFNNSMAGNRSQGIFIKFEDGKYMFLRFSWWDNRYKIEYMQGGGDTWNLPVVQDWNWDDIHLFDETQTNTWTSNQEMRLQLVRSGNTLKVYLDGVCVRTNELNAEYADDKVQVGFFAWDAAEDASWNFEISETLPEA